MCTCMHAQEGQEGMPGRQYCLNFKNRVNTYMKVILERTHLQLLITLSMRFKIYFYVIYLAFNSMKKVQKAAVSQTYMPSRGNEIALGSDSSNKSNFLVWSMVKYLETRRIGSQMRCKLCYSNLHLQLYSNMVYNIILKCNN